MSTRIKYQDQGTPILAGKKIDGLEVAKSVKERVRKSVEELKKQGVEPCLATILVGDNAASGDRPISMRPWRKPRD